MSYTSRKQEINALNTCEAEYVAMSEATKDVLWLAGFCEELTWKHPVPLLLGDNEGAISLTAKPGKHSKSKHIDNKYHMARRNVELKLLTTQHIGTQQMIADIMTKPVTVIQLTRFRKAMKVLPVVTSDDAMITTESVATTTAAIAAADAETASPTTTATAVAVTLEVTPPSIAATAAARTD
ncbi:hypothetical protein PI125_g5539 [Phytophthora idaei]|nr:hypothetical protein PI125_g5539 [Phytophthora idaei]KAG3153564.1 hypothetical protein PI126_g10021 [Phytophthora idaei]